MQVDLIKSDSNEQDYTHTKADSTNNETQIEKDLHYQVDEKLQLNVEYTGKIIDNFDYTTSDMIFWEQPPPYSQLCAAIIPDKYQYAKNQIIISKTSNPRNFFLISNIIYFIWGILAFLLTTAVTIILYITPYFSLWSIFLILNGAMNIFAVLSWSSNGITHLKRVFTLTLCLNTIGFLLSAILSYFTSSLCLNPFNFTCDNILAAYSELVYALIFILATIHNIIHVLIIYNISNEIILKSVPPSV